MKRRRTSTDLNEPIKRNIFSKLAGVLSGDPLSDEQYTLKVKNMDINDILQEEKEISEEYEKAKEKTR